MRVPEGGRCVRLRASGSVPLRTRTMTSDRKAEARTAERVARKMRVRLAKIGFIRTHSSLGHA